MNATPNNALTASRMNCWLRCQRQHYWQFEVGLRKTQTALALAIGSAWHRAMQARWRGATYDQALGEALPEGVELDEYVAATIAGLLLAYYRHWGGDNRNVKMHTEMQFKLPLVGSLTFSLEGKIDRLGVLEDGRHTLVEYKTTGESLTPDSNYWLRLRFNVQLSQYFLAARASGWDVEVVIYDVVRKPSIKPKFVEDVDEEGQKIVVDAEGKRVFIEKGKNKGKPRQTADKAKGYVVKGHTETPEEYGERLAADCIARPDFYFARREVPVMEDDLEEFRVQRLHIAESISFCRQRQKRVRRPEDAWPRNVGEQNCNFCAYNSFCLQNLKVDLNNPPSGFEIQQFNPELNEQDTSSTAEDFATSASNV